MLTGMFTLWVMSWSYAVMHEGKLEHPRTFDTLIECEIVAEEIAQEFIFDDGETFCIYEDY